MRAVNEELIERIDDYVESLFTPGDEVLRENLEACEAAGLPAIGVSPNQGRLLHLLARITRARRILEIGTLGGYSTTWLARALPADGRLISLELLPKNADVARANLSRAGLDKIVEVQVGRAAELLQAMITGGEETFDLVFIDADKPGYLEYLGLSLQLCHPGSILLADNVIRHGDVLEEVSADENARGVSAYNHAIASHPRLESIIVPFYKEKIDGMALSIVK